MNPNQTTRPVRALGLCSGGLDSMLSALVLKRQGIEVAWVSFTTPFFDAQSAQKAAEQTGIPLIEKDITETYMEMMKAPRAGFGKNMNPCMDCHALMFAQAGIIMGELGFDFLFSGEVMGQRPKSQTKNALRYVEKNSGLDDGCILRPLSAKLLPETRVEREGLVDRGKLLDISGRSRKVQMALAEDFGIKEYPSPAGGCLLTDKGFSRRLRDLLYTQNTEAVTELHLLKFGRHFRLSPSCKLVVGRSKGDNKRIMAHYDPAIHIRLHHAALPGPEALMSGRPTDETIGLAALITAGYTKSKPGDPARVVVIEREVSREICIVTPESADFKSLLI